MAGRSLVDPSQEEERQQEGALTCVWDASSDELLFVSQVTADLSSPPQAYCDHDVIPHTPAMLNVRGVPAGSGLAVQV